MASVENRVCVDWLECLQTLNIGKVAALGRAERRENVLRTVLYGCDIGQLKLACS